MDEVLKSIEPVIKASRFVKINSDAIQDFVKTVQPQELNDSEFSEDSIIQDATEEQQVALAFVYNSVNFCYWGEPKWTINIEGKPFDGSAGMLRAIKNGVKDGYKLLDPQFLATLSEKDLSVIFSGNVEIPLFQDRLRLLKSLGQTVINKFDGSFSRVVEAGNNNSVDLVRILSEDFPDIFNDVSFFQGKEIKFYKRAQLVPAHLHDLYSFGLSSHQISDVDKLTAFADYKVPQLLRKFGILEYVDDLADRIDNFVEIPKDSIEEVEIRANTIEAVERVTGVLRGVYPNATASKVDGIFWFRGQTKSPEDKPYHRTRTVWY